MFFSNILFANESLFSFIPSFIPSFLPLFQPSSNASSIKEFLTLLSCSSKSYIPLASSLLISTNFFYQLVLVLYAYLLIFVILHLFLPRTSPTFQLNRLCYFHYNTFLLHLEVLHDNFLTTTPSFIYFSSLISNFITTLSLLYLLKLSKFICITFLILL